MNVSFDDILRLAVPDDKVDRPRYAATTDRHLTRRGLMWLGQTCNLRCHFCYYLDRIQDPSHPEHAFMSLEKAKSICRTLVEVYGNNSIDVQGGEPTLRAPLPDLIRYCKGIGMQVTVITNGILLDDPARVWAYREAGIRDFILSVQGLGPVYDEIVGRQGAWMRQMRALRNIQEAGVPVRFNTVLSKPVLDQLPQIAELAIRTGALVVNFLAFNPFDDQREPGKRGAANVPRYSEVAGPLTAALDAVIVALPTFAHTEAALAVFASGRHLYLESPLAPTLEEGRRIIDAWRRSGRVGMIGLNARYHPLFEEARRAIDRNAVGDIVAARFAFSSRTGSRPPWAEDPARGGGVLLDKAYHEIDLVRFLLGEIDEVSCVAAGGGPRPDTVAINLRCARGCLAHLTVSIGSVADARFDIYGRAGRLSAGRYDSLRLAVDPPEAGGFWRRVRRGVSEVAGLPLLARKLRAPGHDPSFTVALERFIAGVRGDVRAAAPDLAEALACLAVADAARQSLEQGRPVRVPEGER